MTASNQLGSQKTWRTGDTGIIADLSVFILRIYDIANIIAACGRQSDLSTRDSGLVTGK